MKDVTIGLKCALLLILMMIFYMVCVTFLNIPDSGKEQAKTIVPFLLGVIATLTGYYWGNSHSSKPDVPSTAIDATALSAALKIETERIAAAKVDADKVEAERLKAASIVAETVIEKAKEVVP